MELKVHNNLTRQKEKFTTVNPNEVKFYSCGPTTYDFLHVGNARALVVGDLFHRVMLALGYKVNFVRNYTDVDDKIIQRANELKVDPLVHAQRFVDECRKDMDSLGMLPATHTPKVSETMPEIISMISDIINNGAGYVVEGEVFFNVLKADHYGKLSKKDLDGLQHGQRVEVDTRKINPADFVLWKPAKAGEPFWESPWGKGRPGWHIECSAMAKKFLGETVDLHHGGVDLMFPHHENEIAQSEAANKKAFCNCWAHNEFLNFGSEKMSKSLGNVVTMRAFIEKYSGQVLRQILLSVHYRARFDWTDEAIERAIQDVVRIHEFALELSKKAPANCPTDSEALKAVEKFVLDFNEDLANDFNSAGALGQFFSFIRLVRRDVLVKDVSSELLNKIVYAVSHANTALGHIHKDPAALLKQLESLKGSGDVDASWVEGLIEERKKAKSDKNWKRADEIRDELKAKNIVLIDNKDGSIAWKMQ
ncbi:MAG: cysteine--tRNA ligase [Bacteriovoracaceae bacterium]|nr:cysteine--tRNA ligase [Bacteriovoracaceae bacterium]